MLRFWLLVPCLAVLACGSKSTGDAGGTTADATEDVAGAEDIAGTDAASSQPDTTSKPDTSTKPVCNPLQNTGCTDPALPKCGYGADGKPECQKGGTVKLGGACQNPDECEEGLCLSCPSGGSVCANFCISDASCNPGQTCNTITGQKYKVCDFCKYESCKVETVTCKDPKQACYIGTGNGPVCLPKGSAQKGDTCSYPNDCDAGLTCAGADAAGKGVCRAVCRIDGKLDCDPPTVKCENVDGSGYGFCPSL